MREADVFGPLVRRLRNELGGAILVIEHDMPVLMGPCDRNFVMETPAGVRDHPMVVVSHLATDTTVKSHSGPYSTV